MSGRGVAYCTERVGMVVGSPSDSEQRVVGWGCCGAWLEVGRCGGGMPADSYAHLYTVVDVPI